MPWEYSPSVGAPSTPTLRASLSISMTIGRCAAAAGVAPARANAIRNRNIRKWEGRARTARSSAETVPMSFPNFVRKAVAKGGGAERQHPIWERPRAQATGAVAGRHRDPDEGAVKASGKWP